MAALAEGFAAAPYACSSAQILMIGEPDYAGSAKSTLLRSRWTLFAHMPTPARTTASLPPADTLCLSGFTQPRTQQCIAHAALACARAHAPSLQRGHSNGRLE